MSALEIGTVLLLLVAGCWPLFRGGAVGLWTSGWVIVLALAGMVGDAVFRGSPAKPRAPQSIPAAKVTNEYISSKTCRSCHPGEYATWHQTFHRTMTQRATPDTVVGPFEDVVLESRGRRYDLSRQGDTFYVHMVNPNWEHLMTLRGVDVLAVPNPPRVFREIVLTTGSHHYQTYWIAGEAGNELRQLPFIYHLQEQRWIPREDAFLAPPVGRRHFAVWNNNCIQCHAVAGQPGHNETTREFESEVVEYGIACESCHGPARDHVRRHRNPLQRYEQRLSASGDPTIVNPARLDHEASSQVCGQCHALFVPKDDDEWWSHGYTRRYRPGGSLEQSRHLIHYDKDSNKPWVARWNREVPGGLDSSFWADGTCRVGGREYLGMIKSGCYTRGGLSCLSCHSMHQSPPDDQLAERMADNRACLQCHTEFRDHIEEHTRHPVGASGSRCYNCHMPHTSYALFKAIRSHRVDSPNLSRNVSTGRPNACNLCHLDRSRQWAADYLTEWYSQPKISLPAEDGDMSAGVLWVLKGDAAQRAVAAWHFGWQPAQTASGREWMAPFLAYLLDDPYSAVRMVAKRSLRSLPGFGEWQYDFLAPKRERAQSRRMVIQRWSSRGELPPTSVPAAAPLGPNRKLHQQTIQRLLRQRDNRKIYISE